MLRNLFYELYASNPDEVFAERYLNYWSTVGLRNNLSVLVRLVRIGFMRQVGKSLREFPSPRTPSDQSRALLEFFRSLVDAAQAPATPELLRSVVQGDSERKLLWGVLGRIFEILDSNDPQEAAWLTQGSFFLMANLRGLGATPEAVATLAPILKAEHTFLARNAPSLVDLLANPSVSGFLRSLLEWEDVRGDRPALGRFMKDLFSDPRVGLDFFKVLSHVDTDPRAHRAAQQLWERLVELSRLPETGEFGAEAWLRSLLVYLGSEPETPAGQAVQRLLNYASRRVQADRNGVSDGQELLQWLARNPEQLDRVLRSVSHAIDRGDVANLARMAERALR
jgi:hypothetical protein